MENKEKFQSAINISSILKLESSNVKSFTTNNLTNLSISKLKKAILEFNTGILSNHCNIKHPSHDNLINSTNSPLTESDIENIKIILEKLSHYNEESNEYFELNYKLIGLIQGYLKSDEYLSIVQSNADKLKQIYSQVEIKPSLSIFKDNIVFDLDETLIHSENPIDHDKSYNYIISENNIGLFERPYLKEMLKEISTYYNIILFSAGKSDYVEAILDKIGIKNQFSIILSREFCISPCENFYIKDLNIIDIFLKEYYRDHPEFLDNIVIDGIVENVDMLQETIIADNHLISFSNNLSQGIIVNDFFGDPTDDELVALSLLLRKLKIAKHDSAVSLSFLLDQSFNYSSY